MTDDEQRQQAVESYIANNGVTKCPPCRSGDLPQYDLGEVLNSRLERMRSKAAKASDKSAWRRGIKGAQASVAVKHLPHNDT